MDSPESAVIDQWRQICDERGFPPVMPISPVIVRDTVVFRTATQIFAIGLFDGQLRWSVASDRSIRDRIAEIREGVAAPDVTASIREWFGANEKLRTLSSDGQRVYAIDGPPSIVRAFANRGIRFTDMVDVPISNRLVALNLAPAEPGKSQVAWELVASDRGRQEGCHFLGHPVAAGEWLLCLAELQREIVLLMIEAESGEVVWRQPLAAVPHRLTEESERARLFRNYSPVVMDGIAICPTSTGLAVAVDFTRRQLKWLQVVGPAPQALQQVRRGVAAEAQTTPDPWGFLSRWQVVGDSVYLSAPESRWLHAFDVDTGDIRWRAPLGEREFFAGILADCAVVLGTSEVRRHALTDGGLLGRTPLPAPPAGQPLLLGDRLLVPLLNGTHWSFDPATGNGLEDAWLQSKEGCEHLYPAGEFVVEMRPESVTVFPTESRARHDLELARTSGRLSDAASLEAELAILNRDLPKAEGLLERAISGASSEGLRLPMQRRLREVLLTGLQRGEVADGHRFRRLQELSVTPAEVAEVRVRESVWLREQGHWAELLGLLEQTESLPGDALTTTAGDPERQVSMDGFREGLAHEIAESPIRPAFVTRLKQQLDRAQRDSDVTLLLRLVELARPVGELDAQRLEVARQLDALGLRGAAEQLRLSLKESDDPQVAIAASQDLCQLWAAGGWLTWAARECRDLQRSGGLDPTWSKTFDDTPAGAVVRELAQAEWPEELHARIEVQSRDRTVVIPPLMEQTGRRSRGLLGDLDSWTPRTGDMPDFGFQGSMNASRLALPPDWPVGFVGNARWGLNLVDRFGAVAGRESELRYSRASPAYATGGNDSEIGTSGTLIPLAVPGGVLAISPLDTDKEHVWTQRPAILRTRTAYPKCGSLHPDVAVLQSHNVLFAVNTVDGRLRWIRRDLPSRSGYDRNTSAGVFGTRDRVAVVNANHKDFLVYRQRDGSSLGTVTLPRSGSNRDVVVGDSLFFVGDPPELGSTIRPLMRWSADDKLAEVVDVLHERLQIRAVDNNHVCYLAPGPVLKLYAVAQRRELLAVPLSAEQTQQVREFRAWLDEDRLYVNVQRESQRVATRDFNEYPRLVPMGGPELQPIRDDLFAVDLKTQQIVWSRRLPLRGLLPLTSWRAPFWLLFSNIRHREDQTLLTMRVELLDLRTGEIVAARDSLPTQESLLGLFVDPARREFSVLGNSRIFRISVNPGRLTPGPTRQAQSPRLDPR
ncbi:MAG TPA: PQQ-binding-like beta-propeller repeat protein [Planctomycetaceae bacterium]|nr:PQQ-binding-like beta-propeller repeat protein [Planctomycetaceae bacterium]